MSLSSKARVLPVVALSALLACGGGRSSGLIEDRWAGNMADRTYSGGAQQAPRANALNEPVRMQDFEGEFVWSDYAAPWCGPCRQQAREMHVLEERFSDRVTFLTVMTSASTAYEDRATVQTAAAWASAHGLNPARVVAATNLWSKTVPEHRLYSPDGHTLLVYRGFLPASTAAELLDSRIDDWLRWKRTGDTADWMWWG